VVSTIHLLKEMCHSTMLGQHSSPCLIVIKRGSATNVTIGRANHIRSFTWTYFDDDHKNPRTSKDWPILPYDHKSGPFSDVVTLVLPSSTAVDASVVSLLEELAL